MAPADDSQPNTAPNGVEVVRLPTVERARRFMAARKKRPRLSLQNKVLVGMTSTLLLLAMAVVAVFFAQKEETTRDRSRQSVDLRVELGRLQSALTSAM